MKKVDFYTLRGGQAVKVSGYDDGEFYYYQYHDMRVLATGKKSIPVWHCIDPDSGLALSHPEGHKTRKEAQEYSRCHMKEIEQLRVAREAYIRQCCKLIEEAYHREHESEVWHC